MIIIRLKILYSFYLYRPSSSSVNDEKLTKTDLSKQLNPDIENSNETMSFRNLVK